MVTRPWGNSGLGGGRSAWWMNVFQQREALVAALESRSGLGRYVFRMTAVSLASALVYGTVLGAQIGGWQVVSSPIKLPLILVGTALLCITALYVLLALAGARLTWLQVIGLAMCSVTASGLTMLASLPITAFWTYCFAGMQGPITLTHAGMFFLSGWIGARFGLEIAARFLHETRFRRVLMVWMAVYGLVAQQMAWLFRPHFSATEVFMRPLDSGGTALERVFSLLFGGG